MHLEDALQDLVGLRCFSAIAGSGVEFAFALHLGEKQRRFLRLANQRLSFLQRTYEGSHMLVVECTWRLDGPDGVIASCFDRAKPWTFPAVGGLQLCRARRDQRGNPPWEDGLRCAMRMSWSNRSGFGAPGRGSACPRWG